MSSSGNHAYFVEFTTHGLIAARLAHQSKPRTLEGVKEFTLDNIKIAADGLQVLFPERQNGLARVIASIRPSGGFVARYSGLPDAAFWQNQPLAPNEPRKWVAIDPQNGSAINSKSGNQADVLVAASETDALEKINAVCSDLSLEPIGLGSAACVSAGAVSRMLRATKDDDAVILLDLGDTSSCLFRVTARGIQNAVTVPQGLETVIARLQEVLSLKFKGSATRLFFNDAYDFTDAGPKIAETLAGALKQSGDIFEGAKYFLCTGVPSKQQWVTQHLSDALDLVPFLPDFSSLNSAGIEIAGGLKETDLSASWIGLTGLLSAFPKREDQPITWFPTWNLGADEEQIDANPADAASSENAAPADPQPAAPEEALSSDSATADAVDSVNVPDNTAMDSLPDDLFDEPAVGEDVPAGIETKPATADETPSSDYFYGSSRSKKKSKSKSSPEGASEASTVASGKKPVGLIIAVAAALILAAGGLFYWHTVSVEKQQQIAEHNREVAAQKAAAQEQKRLAAEKAKEAAARREAEQQAKAMAAKLAAMKAAQAKQAQEEAERRANARGSIQIQTQPAGASIIVDDLPAKSSPAIFNKLKLGQHTVKIALANYESQTLTVSVAENQTTSPDPVVLKHSIGSIHLTSDPENLSYTITPAGSSSFVSPFTSKSAGKSGSRRQGQTPADVTDLPTGSYTVTVLRPGWKTFTKTVTVKRNETSTTQAVFPGGTVTIDSDPEAATVLANGKTIGTTPLTLNGVQPGNVRYEVALDNYVSAKLDGQVQSEKTLTLTAKLKSIDGILLPSDVDTPPQALNPAGPDLPGNLRWEGWTATVQIVVDNKGDPRDFKILSANNDRYAKLCIDALKKWRFKPGTIDGKPVKVQLVVPFHGSGTAFAATSHS